MLEGREKCEMKLTKPLKFKTGRRDCKTEEDRKFVTKDHEVGINHFLKNGNTLFPSLPVAPQPMGRRSTPGRLWSKGVPHGSRALDGAAGDPWGHAWSWDEHQVHLVWTWIHLQCLLQEDCKQANLSNWHRCWRYIIHFTFFLPGGGDLSFLACVGEGSSQTYVRNIAIGDQNGQPVAMTGWFVLEVYVVLPC